jgi:DUF4097 and DUF4098 domain-containing protein YvlB
MKRLPLGVGATIAVLTIGSGAYSLAAFAARNTTTKNVRFEGVTAIRIESKSGGITLRGSSDSSATGTRKVVQSFTKPSIQETVSADGVLLLRNRCSAFMANCEVSYTLTVPKGVRIEGQTSGGSIKLIELTGAVNVKSSAGGISAQAMSGALTLHSSAGSVRVDGASGALDLSSSAGGVTVTDATSQTVKAESSAGGVNLTFLRAPMTIDAESSAGGVKVVLPPGADAYEVDASTSAGNTTIDVKTDPESERKIKLRSSAGNVSVRYGPATKPK